MPGAPGWQTGRVPTETEWNTAYALKSDWLQRIIATSPTALQIGSNNVVRTGLLAATLTLPSLTASFTASVLAPNILNVSAVAAGVLAVGMEVAGAGVVSGSAIVGLGSGTGNTGTYFLNQPQILGSEAMTGGVAEGESLVISDGDFNAVNNPVTVNVAGGADLIDFLGAGGTGIVLDRNGFAISIERSNGVWRVVL